jgi:hypothetical protein
LFVLGDAFAELILIKPIGTLSVGCLLYIRRIDLVFREARDPVLRGLELGVQGDE